MSRRYAVYAAPPRGSTLARWGAAWLGRDAESDVLPAPATLPGWSAADLARITAAPRHYGLHATLKPPFRLAAGKGEAGLLAAIERLAAGRPPPAPMRLRLAAIGRFLALVPDGDDRDRRALADACVERLDEFRAPPDAAELAKRSAANLTPREQEHLRRWGYPYVFDTFRWHMTLTGALEPGERDALLRALTPVVAPLVADQPALADIALFIEETGRPFRLDRRFRLDN